MRLLSKSALLFLLIGLFTSPMMAAIHCVDFPEDRIGGSASLHLAHQQDNDCSVHENAASANFVIQKKITGDHAERVTSPVTLTPPVKLTSYLVSALPSFPPPALPLALSSILRI